MSLFTETDSAPVDDLIPAPQMSVMIGVSLFALGFELLLFVGLALQGV